MKRTTVTALATATALAALLTGCGSGQGAAATQPENAPETSTQPASATPTPSSSAAAANAGAEEAAYVAEAVSLKPELSLARAALVKMGHEMCAAFREKPGDVASLVRNAKADGTSADDVETLRVVAVAAIHNLCTDQSGDL